MIMEKYGLMGWPVEHSKSPDLFRAAYAGAKPYELIGYPSWEECLRHFLDGPYRAVNITAPYKADAARVADFRDAAVEELGAANILVKTERGLEAYNSDFLGVRELLRPLAGSQKTVKVIGGGGAGRAAYGAAKALGFEVTLLRHNEIADGAEADIIIFTLPRVAEGSDRLRCNYLLEANYRDPAFGTEGGIPIPEGCTYIHGMQWLVAQAVTGYELMSGEAPDADAIRKVFR